MGYEHGEADLIVASVAAISRGNGIRYPCPPRSPGWRPEKEFIVRFFVRAVIPTVAGNIAIIDGKIGAIIEGITKELKPEVAFFRANEAGPTAGLRSMSMIVSADNASQLAQTIEPLFKPLEAKLEYEPAMFPDDLLKALPAMERDVKKYGDDGRGRA